MKDIHPLDEAVEQAEDIYQTIRAYAIDRGLLEQEHDGYRRLAQLRELLAQSKGIVDGFERRM